MKRFSLILLCGLAAPSFAAITLTDHIQTYHDESKSFYTINVKYPQIQNKSLTLQQKEFNTRIQTLVQKDMQEFLQNLNNIYPGNSLLETAKSDNVKLTPQLNQENFEWKVLLNQNNLISLQIKGKSFVYGSYSDTNFHTITYNLQTGKQVQLKDLFQPNTPYLEKISQYVRQELTRQMGSLAKDKQMLTGTEPTEKNFQHWNLTPEGILISFDAFQVGSDSAGAPEVLIPYSVFQSSIQKI